MQQLTDVLPSSGCCNLYLVCRSTRTLIAKRLLVRKMTGGPQWIFHLQVFHMPKKKGVYTHHVWTTAVGTQPAKTLEQVLDTALQRTSTASMRHLANVTSWLARFPSIPNETHLFAVVFFRDWRKWSFVTADSFGFMLNKFITSVCMPVCILRVRRRCIEMMNSHVIERNNYYWTACMQHGHTLEIFGRRL